MKLWKTGCALGSLFLVGAWAFAETIESPTGKQLADYWGSGAELTKFDLSQARYGESHAGHAELIFAREPFLVEEQVKRDFGDGEAVPALKLNALRTFNTGLYSYRTMQSTFAAFDRAAFPYALKSSLSVQDWCGQVYQQINWEQAAWGLRSFSYFQNSGDQDLHLEGVWLEDDFWLVLRQDPNDLPVGEFRAIPALLFGRLAHVESRPERVFASLEVDGEVAVYRVRYPDLKRTLQIEFKRAFPYYIQGWKEEDSQGTTTARRTHGMGQVEYWKLNAPGDARLREGLGLEKVPD